MTSNTGIALSSISNLTHGPCLILGQPIIKLKRRWSRAERNTTRYYLLRRAPFLSIKSLTSHQKWQLPWPDQQSVTQTATILSSLAG